ncbi:zinc ribbon domain-containing protein [Propioniciclava sinopodophylli]|uniref:Zinc ribbon domain-containing protein n=1 Tax=Propioniciclava sinopodophylli TaxID=1837344 RepID=A0A4Q9KGG5_9ACTN|nr:FmdB family zinc ribbon protein [Propioniciclava sinopodophylli]TBT88405.1 zinc ribbon domain-containing protein [Propioniciclava sinopodophylli]
MPTYQYRCADCGRELEVVQKFTDASLTECPSCTGDLRKVFNAVGVVFKGSGFYATDNRTKGKTDATKPATSAPAAESSSPPASAPAASATPAKGSAA